MMWLWCLRLLTQAKTRSSVNARKAQRTSPCLHVTKGEEKRGDSITAKQIWSSLTFQTGNKLIRNPLSPSTPATTGTPHHPSSLLPAILIHLLRSRDRVHWRLLLRSILRAPVHIDNLSGMPRPVALVGLDAGDDERDEVQDPAVKTPVSF